VVTECGVICKLESEVAGGLDGSMERRSEWVRDVKQGFFSPAIKLTQIIGRPVVDSTVLGDGVLQLVTSFRPFQTDRVVG